MQTFTPPPKRELLAALTIASTLIFVISFLIICIFSQCQCHHSLDGPSCGDFVHLNFALPIYHFKFFQDAISLFIEILTNGLIVWSKSFPMHFAPFFQAAVIFALFESVVCADLIERNNRYFCITDDTRRRKTSIYRAVYCNSYSLYGNMPPTSFLQSFRLSPLYLHKS